LHDCIDSGRRHVASDLREVAQHALTLSAIWSCLQPDNGPAEERRAKFVAHAALLAASSDPLHTHMGRIMNAFAPGLFAGGDDPRLPADNLDLERAFRLPKGHERRIHGRAHAGVRIVQQGPTLLPALDAHARHPDPFDPAELRGYVHATIPDSQLQSERRRRVMRKARSRRARPALLATLEQRFRTAKPAT